MTFKQARSLLSRLFEFFRAESIGLYHTLEMQKPQNLEERENNIRFKLKNHSH